MRAAVIGAGAVGARVARQLVATDAVSELVIVTRSRPNLAASLGPRARVVPDEETATVDADVVVVAIDDNDVVALARRQLEAGRHVVVVADRPALVRDLLGLDPVARRTGRAMVVGAGFSPGLSCLLARLLAGDLDHVDEIHVAKSGTGGPACAREHHRALGATATDIRDGRGQIRPAGSGRELCWFPDPVGPRDCYRVDAAEPLLLARAFPNVGRITVRAAATRRDRITAQLPMLRAPHPEGIDGAVRVEVRGRLAGGRRTVVAGSTSPPAVASGAVAAAVAIAVVTLGACGAMGLGQLNAPGLLAEVVERGVRVARFDGTPV